MDVTPPAADVAAGAIDEDEVAACASCCLKKLAASVVNKADD